MGWGIVSVFTGNPLGLLSIYNGAKNIVESVTKVSSVAVSGVSLNKSSVSLAVGSSTTLSSAITPYNATNKSVFWSSSNTAVASVSSNGTVTAVGTGSATITVTTSNGGKKANCTVSVTKANVTLSSVSANGSTSQTSTQLTLTFSQAITGLSVGNITLSGVSGVTKGTLSGSGSSYTLPISGFTASGNLNVAVPGLSNYNVSGSPKTTTIYYLPSYTVTFNSNGGSSVTSQTVNSGSTATRPTNPTRSGYTFDNWYSNSGLTTVYNFSTAVTGNITLYAKWNSVSSSSIIEMVQIPAGTFTMGSPSTEAGRDDYYEGPQHQVTLSGFYMGKYEVTQEQFQAVMGTNPSYYTTAISGESGTPGKLPVERVSWYDAIVFCNKLSIAEGLSPAYRISGSSNPADWGSVPTSSNSTWNSVAIVVGSNGYRLPTEAQWEYYTSSMDNLGMRVCHLNAFFQYALETKHYTLKKIKKRFGGFYEKCKQYRT